MSVEELIEYRDQFNEIVLKHQKKNKKWVILCVVLYLVGFLSVIIPAAIIGDNQGQEKPPIFKFFTILGIIILVAAIICNAIYIYHQIIINKNKKYKETLSHELTLLVMKHQDHTDKEFPFIKKS